MSGVRGLELCGEEIGHQEEVEGVQYSTYAIGFSQSLREECKWFLSGSNTFQSPCFQGKVKGIRGQWCAAKNRLQLLPCFAENRT